MQTTTRASVVEVTHFGNRASGEGGIAAVIRQHLQYYPPPLSTTAVTTYDQDATTALGRQRPWVRALGRAAMLPRQGSVAHVHLSRRASLIREGALVLLLRLRRVPVVVTLHGSTLLTVRGLPLAVIRLLLRAADVTHGFDESYRALFGVPARRWATIPNSVDLPPAPAQKRPIVVFAGRVGRRKGADILMSAWHDMPHGSELHVFGPVDEDAGIPTSGIAGVTLHGLETHTTVLAALQQAAILVQPSRAEAFPMAVCEALAAGCAVIGTDVGALGALLRAAGQVVVPLDASVLRKTMASMLDSAQQQATLGAAARRYATTHLGSDVIAARWNDIYVSIARTDSRRWAA